MVFTPQPIKAVQGMFLSMVSGRVVKPAGSGKTILLSFDKLVAVSLLVIELQETAILQEIKFAFKVIS